MNKQKGFTIIELIVVIAIIAVLAAIVLVNVTSYINKSRVAAIQGNMATLLTNGAAYVDGTSGATGDGFVKSAQGCGTITSGVGDSAIGAAIDGASGTGLACYGSAVAGNTDWCAEVTAPGNIGDTGVATWCVDSTGNKGTTANCAVAHFTSE
jgi:prepilin-type N-terminal cleavage/methylation domain-containing protein